MYSGAVPGRVRNTAPMISSFARSGVQLDGGAYTLNITIPTPGSLAALSLAGLLAARRRRN